MAGIGGGIMMVVRPWILYFCLALLTCYVVLDLLVNHSHLALPSSLLSCPSCSSFTALGSGSKSDDPIADAHLSLHDPSVCTTLQGHLDVNLTSDPTQELEEAAIAAGAWKQMKWIGRAATCRVRGHFIEKLDPALNFRRGFALKFVTDVEDKTHMLPWLLATRVDLNARKRRVLLDLGANAFSTSLTWFLRMYPCDFTEVHAFEVDKTLLRKPKHGFAEEANHAGPNGWAVMVKKEPRVPAWMLSRIRVYNEYVGDHDDVKGKAVNITRFMKEELRLQEGDTVVVKMDIEGSEWPILRRWVEDPAMAAIVDELFVEVHYDHPSMRGYNWAKFAPTTREQAHALLAELRLHGFYAHAWP